MKLKRILIGLVVLFAIYFVASPYITVYQMQKAAEQHDAPALSAYIDFPRVRQSMKDQLNGEVADKLGGDVQDNPFAALGSALAGVVVDKMVDVYVTPSAIEHLMAGEKPKSAQGDEGQPVPTNTDTHPKEKRKPWADASMSYESLNRFAVNVKVEGGASSKFVLHREGLGWKLAEITLPLKD